MDVDVLLFLVRRTFLRPVAVCSYTDIGMRVPFLFSQLCVTHVDQRLGKHQPSF